MVKIIVGDETEFTIHDESLLIERTNSGNIKIRRKQQVQASKKELREASMDKN